MNLGYMLNKRNVSQKELSAEIGISEPMISKFKNFVCLPIPDDMKKICEKLECEVLDLYDKEEITFIAKKQKRAISDLEVYKFTVDLPAEFRPLFESKTLKQLGYHTLQDLMIKLVISKLAKKKAKLDQKLQTKSNLTIE